MNEMKSLWTGLAIGIALSAIISGLTIDIRISNKVEERAKALNLMRYDSKTDRFVAKDTIVLNKYEMHYLQYGTMKDSY